MYGRSASDNWLVPRAPPEWQMGTFNLLNMYVYLEFEADPIDQLNWIVYEGAADAQLQNW